jgi:hypothetical protein
MMIIGKILLFPWVKKNTHQAGGNAIAHLLFFLIAAPEM